MAELELDLSTRAKSGAMVRRLKHADAIFWGLTLVAGLVVIGLAFAVGLVSFLGSHAARTEYGWGLWFSPEWRPSADLAAATYGAWPAIRGTLLSSGLALLLAGPAGLAFGVFLAELCPAALRKPLGLLVELLATIPSVIYGLWGITMLAPLFASLPWNAESVVPQGLLLATLVLALMILPTIVVITRDVLLAVPHSQRELMLALGATRWEAIWGAVLPCARTGLAGALILGLGRALGETIVATMLIGNSAELTHSLLAPSTTGAALLAQELPHAQSPLHTSALMGIALGLFAVTIVLQLASRLLIWRTAAGPARAHR